MSPGLQPPFHVSFSPRPSDPLLERPDLLAQAHRRRLKDFGRVHACRKSGGRAKKRQQPPHRAHRPGQGGRERKHKLGERKNPTSPNSWRCSTRATAMTKFSSVPHLLARLRRHPRHRRHRCPRLRPRLRRHPPRRRRPRRRPRRLRPR